MCVCVCMRVCVCVSSVIIFMYEVASFIMLAILVL